MAVTAFIASAVLIVVVGAAIFYTQKEDEKANLAGKSSVAMKMAEQALSRAIWKAGERVQNWDTLMAGTTIADYNNDKKFVEGDGEYCIKIEKASSSNLPNETDLASKIVITATGRDKDGNDLKTLKTVYKNESEKPDYVIYVLNEKKHKRKSNENLCKNVSKKVALLQLKSSFLDYANAWADSLIPEAYASDKKDDDKDKDDYEFDEDQLKGVHWGPICVLGDWRMANKSSRYWFSYPRKFATGSIKGRDTNSNPPNTDGVEWWSYSDQVPSAPTLDYEYYKTIAQNSGSYNGTLVYPGGGEYHRPGSGSNCVPAHGNRYGANHDDDKKEGDENDNHWLVSRLDTSSRCYFFDGMHCKISGDTFIQGIIIARNGKVTIRAGKGSRSQGVYPATVPPNAWKEYGKIDTSASGEYPADAGYQSVNGSYSFTSSNAVTVKGVIWADKEVHMKGSAVFHGIMIVGKKFKFDGSGDAQVFYDHTINLKATEVSLVQDSYNEVRGSWPSGL